MHVLKEHNYTYTDDYCKRQLPAEDTLLCLHIKNCKEPCDGHPDCY